MRSFCKSVAVVTCVAYAEMTEKPIRSRFNAAILKDLFHKGDQRMLLAFSDLSMDNVANEGYAATPKVVDDESTEVEKEELPEEVRMTDSMVVSLSAPEGTDPNEYDFEFSLNDPESGSYMGFQGLGLLAKGEGFVKGSNQAFKFTAPVTGFKVEVEMVAEELEDILKYNEKAQKPL
jgi:hypothetical protein